MSKYIAVITRAAITRAALVEAGGRSMEQVKAACGCQYILNAWFYDTITGRPVGNLKIDGTVKADAGWNCQGLTWDAGEDIRMDLIPDRGRASYISGVELLTPTRGPGKALSYSPEYGGTRGRSAVLLAGARVILYCSGDGTRDAKTPERLRDDLVEVGGQYANTANLLALGLDSGGSSQCDFGDNKIIHSARRVAGYFCVWTTDAQTPGEENNTMSKKYTVTPGIGVNIRKGPGTGYDKVGGYSKGTVITVLEERDGWGRTDKGWVKLSNMSLHTSSGDVTVTDRKTDTGVPIKQMFVPKGRKNRPGGANPCTYITIHETGNKATGADAEAHGAYVCGDSAEASRVSWHYTVDDDSIVQHIPDEERAYHAGDGANGPGNAKSIGIEICVNEDGDFEKAKANAASLVRLLMKEHGIQAANIKQHHDWSGKDCPHTIRHTSGAWAAFLALCNGEPVDAQLSAAVDKLAAKGLINSPDYWKGGVYSAANVQALLKKWAASL